MVRKATKTVTRKPVKRTAIVIYTNSKLSTPTAIGACKKYSFNVSNSVKVGDLIKVNDYSTPIQIVKILDKPYKYYNSATGEMSDDYTSTLQWEIRDLVINDEVTTSTVYGKIIK